MAQPGISPGIGAVKDDNLITGIQDDITGLCGRLLIITYDALRPIGPTCSKPRYMDS